MTRHTLLLVDDEPEVLEGLRRTLRKEPYRILTAGTAAEARRLVATEAIDLIVSDIDMPGESGLDLLAHLRTTHPEIVRVLLTGDASLEAALHAINQGEVHRFLTKPWDKTELRQTLAAALARLDELRRAAAAERQVDLRDDVLAELERSYPGITRVEPVDGQHLIDVARLRPKLATLGDPRLRALFAEPRAENPSHTRRLRPSGPQEPRIITRPDPAWRHLGVTANADFYGIEPDLVAVVPHADTRDDATTARASIAFQDRHWRQVGHRGAAAVYMDNVLEQDAGARAVYAGETDATLTTCYALIGETFYGHAAGAVFTGLTRPGPPTQVFRSLADARPWIAAHNRDRGGPP